MRADHYHGPVANLMQEQARVIAPAAISGWAAERPICVLWSTGAQARDHWLLIAEPSAIIRANDRAGVEAFLSALSGADTSNCPPPSGSALDAGWLAALSYECGAIWEPRGFAAAPAPLPGWPLAEFLRCEPPTEDLLGCLAQECAPRQSWSASELLPTEPAGQFRRKVERTVELIRAGDIFQANLTHRFEARLRGSRRAFAADALERIGARYGAYIELDEQRAILSFSPESFLRFDPATRKVVATPMKGTRPAPGALDEVERAALEASPKDAAELAMIVDLMRNDLGRVCESGSVRVAVDRLIERHPTVWQATAEVRGRLRRGLGIGDLLAATFPPGSVTGAPKTRALQVIGELEGTPRGPYCGALGFLGDDGSMNLSVAIRTIVIEGDRLMYGAGCGIVADSDPEDEWRECLQKTAVMRLALGLGL